jgi:exopolysaccharide biosynthesis polyprenyl glycosylphosphotransferase
MSEPERLVQPQSRPAEATRERVWMPARWRLRRQWRDALLRRMLALADASAVLLVSVSLATFLSGDVHQALWSAFFLPLWILLAKLFGLYDRDQRSLRHLTVDEIQLILMWALTGTAVVSVVMLIVPSESLEVSTALRMWAIVASAAFVFRATMRWIWRRLVPPEATLIVGEGPLAEATRRKFEIFPDMHVVLAGTRVELPAEELRENPEWADGIDRIVLASHQIDETLIAQLVTFCRKEQIKLSVVPPARGMFGTAVQLDHIADLPVVEYNTWAPSRSTLALKRVLDAVVSLGALILLSPLFVLIALAIRLGSRGPIVFGQRRAGFAGQPFRLFKFRTMVSNAEELLPQLVSIGELRDPMFKLPNDPRVTRVGRVLRRTSLDELPQLWNVLRGEMSLVGPRPEEVELVEMYAPEHRFRLKVKPGLTGPMQVYGRGALGFDERLAVEREYIENLSLTRDLRIIALTLTAVVSGRGAY